MSKEKEPGVIEKQLANGGDPEKVEGADEAGRIQQEINGSANRANAKIEKVDQLLAVCEGHYNDWVLHFEENNVSVEGIPTWEAIKHGFTPDVLDKVLELRVPFLFLTIENEDTAIKWRVYITEKLSQLEVDQRSAEKAHFVELNVADIEG